MSSQQPCDGIPSPLFPVHQGAHIQGHCHSSFHPVTIHHTNSSAPPLGCLALVPGLLHPTGDPEKGWHEGNDLLVTLQLAIPLDQNVLIRPLPPNYSTCLSHATSGYRSAGGGGGCPPASHLPLGFPLAFPVPFSIPARLSSGVF